MNIQQLLKFMSQNVACKMTWKVHVSHSIENYFQIWFSPSWRLNLLKVQLDHWENFVSMRKAAHIIFQIINLFITCHPHTYDAYSKFHRRIIHKVFCRVHHIIPIRYTTITSDILLNVSHSLSVSSVHFAHYTRTLTTYINLLIL